jgi:hypothetical protein
VSDSTFDPELIAQLRRSIPSRIAEELVSVQPMPNNIDWDALGKAYGALVAAHGKPPLIPFPNKTDNSSNDV